MVKLCPSAANNIEEVDLCFDKCFEDVRKKAAQI